MNKPVYTDELTRWYLDALAANDATDITGDVFEVIGESNSSTDVSITKLASSAQLVIWSQNNRIKELEKTLRELRDMARNRSKSAYNCGPFQYTDLCDTVAGEANDALKSGQRAENGSSDPGCN